MSIHITLVDGKMMDRNIPKNNLESDQGRADVSVCLFVESNITAAQLLDGFFVC